MNKQWITGVTLSIASVCYASDASAQLRPKTGRFSLDGELLSAGRVHLEPDDNADRDSTKTTVIGIGANQLGSSRAYLPSTPLGAGAGYVFDEQWIVGLRLGFGYDWISPEEGPNERVVAVSAVPKLTWVSDVDDDTNVFVDAGPLVQYNRLKSGDQKQSLLAGGFEVGAGGIQFFGENASLDFGAYFQGRFGKLDQNGDTVPDSQDVDIRDLRGVIRLGGSLWTRRREHYEGPTHDLNNNLETRTPPPATGTAYPAQDPAYSVPPPVVAPVEPAAPPAPTLEPAPTSPAPLPAAPPPSPNSAPLR